jgi:hypothetical protein
MTPRRRFLQSAAAVAAGMTGNSLNGYGQAPAPAGLPTVKFGKHDISRLVLGSNQFYGYSHFNRLLDQTMREWYTPDRIDEVMRRCEQNGINAYQYAHSERAAPDLERYQARGGAMKLIAVNLTPSPIEEVARVIKPAGLYYHGERTDVLFREGKMDAAREFTKKVRQLGVMVGIGTHKPEVVELVEEQGWDVDFYLLCAYNRTRTRDELQKLLGHVPVQPSEVYLEEDLARTYRVIRQTKRTCFVFKILAAGRLSSPQQVDAAFKTALDGIKPQDCVVVGMYPRYLDEVKENADRVRRILGTPA